MRSILRVFVLASIALFHLPSFGQLPLVDITLTDDGMGNLEVRVRPDGPFNQLFSSIVFTVRWETASGATLDEVQQDPPASSYIPVFESGPVNVTGGMYTYQVFAGLGFQSLNSTGTSWVAGQEYVIARIPVIGGPAVFQIVNDVWTGDIANNGDFYVSLNGEDKTGSIYSGSTGVLAGMAPAGLSLQPNPSQGISELTYTVSTTSDVRLRVANSAGQIVWSRELKGFSGVLRETIDLARQGKGVYMLTIEDVGGIITRRIVVQ